MNITIITSELPYPCNSGGRKYTWERIKVLKNSGNRISLISLVDDISEIDKKEIGKYCNSMTFFKRKKNICNIILNIHKPFSAITRYSKEIENQVLEQSKEGKIDCLIIDAPQLLYNVNENISIPVVCTQHNIEFKAFQSIASKSNNILKKSLYYFEAFKLKKMEEKYLKKRIIKGYTFISKEDYEYFRTKYEVNSVEYIPMGYDIRSNGVTVSKLDTKNKNIVFVGKMSYYPNSEGVTWFVKNVFDKIQQEVENVKLYIVGKEPPKEVKAMEKNKNIIVTGMVDSVEEYLKEADIVIIPILSGGGVKIKLIEAISAQKIVVTTTKGVEGTSFKNNKHVLIADEPGEFASKCIQALINTEEYNKMALDAFDMLCNEYSWDIIGKRYNSFLLNVINN